MSPRRRDIQNVIKLISLPCAVFDKDRSGFASSSEIKTVMANLGVHFTDEEIQEMMIEVTEISRSLSFSIKSLKADVNGDNQVDFNEFKAMMTAK